MSEKHTLSELAYGCSDRGELKDKIEEAIHNGDKINYRQSKMAKVCINTAFDEMDEDIARKYLASIKLNNPPCPKFIDALDEAISTLAEEVADYYKRGI
tara:strand:+ start:754 stop:1050 length:297 start_codon:yes stop_codon:yes gene_type:complete